MAVLIFLFFLGFSLAFGNIFEHPASTPKWAFASLVLPILLIWLKPKQTTLWGICFLAWAVIFSTPEQAWRYAILAMAFAVGTAVEDYRWGAAGMALGIAVSGVILVAQHLGWDLLLAPDDPGALFFGGTFLGDAAAITAASLIPILGWWVVPVGGVIALLSASKSGLFALYGCTLIYTYPRKIFWVLVLLLIPLAYLGFTYTNSLQVRIPLWVNSLLLIDLFGNESFRAIYPTVHDKILPTDKGIFSALVRPQTAHNDIITLLVELGPVGVFLFLGLMFQVRHYAIWAFLLVGIFSFPLYVPIAVYVAFVAGNVSRTRPSLRLFPGEGRSRIHQGQGSG